jgi:hypothetical protein
MYNNLIEIAADLMKAGIDFKFVNEHDAFGEGRLEFGNMNIYHDPTAPDKRLFLYVSGAYPWSESTEMFVQKVKSGVYPFFKEVN